MRKRGNEIVRRVWLRGRQLIGEKPLPEEQLGLLGPDTVDARDKRHLRVAQDAPVLNAFSLRQYIPEIRNQGRINSCTGHSLCTALEILVNRMDLGAHQFSPMHIYYHARLRSGFNPAQDDKGAFLREAIKVLHKDGVPHLDAMPDTNRAFERPPRVPPDHLFRIHKYERIADSYVSSNSVSHRVVDVMELRKVLQMEYLPVICGVEVFQRMAEGTFWDLPSDVDTHVGYHAICLTGFMHRGTHTEDLWFEFVNSWGPQWGDQGKGYVSSRYLQQKGFDFWTFESKYW